MRIFSTFPALMMGAATLLGCAGLPQAPELPTYPKVQRTTWLDEQWKGQPRVWYRHASQGTATFGVPYEWFVALERPELSIWSPGLLSDPDYLERFGFIRGEQHPEYNPDGLPVGFAKGTVKLDPTTGKAFSNPATEQPMTDIGLTCAGCHTGVIDYQGTRLLIDGGPALVDLGKFRDALGIAVGLTEALPKRFDRFADRVLGNEAGEDARQALKLQLGAAVTHGKAMRALEDRVAPQSVAEGFGRLDALNRIGNEIFALQLDEPANFAPKRAPVNYPHLWGTPWFDWVQYDASIQQPMVRNAGEALGVRALVNLTGLKTPLFTSTVPVRQLYEMETMLAGAPPHAARAFTGLRAPVWPEDVLPKIDRELAARGANLYQALCQSCHLPPTSSEAFWHDDFWTTPNGAKESYLKLRLIDIVAIGTDPEQAEGLMKRTVSVPSYLSLKGPDDRLAVDGRYPFGAALGQIVEMTVNRAYDSASPPFSAAERERMNGNRPNGIRALPAYKARPLDGIWATAPYLHNGSVPTLYDLLLPTRKRPKEFTLGSREFDPRLVGYRSAPLTGGFSVKTSLPGNFNTGHEFDDGPRRTGVIGRGLTDAERFALIEYLKTL
ncbi:hypothetical protein FW320_30720 [Azospirillum sp. Vi22]|uniref:di-heme-cytochrome C peroxidase n=1 Tax=Azospirillum baldaniorum TaxID=1064539 RepID=UPI00157B00D3|nr:di-heme-cytochrome C peroxidase [Azospirillum baldaniorum]NUB10515.1 hypothetical protein [Azospirillum baldaniorum]